MSFAKIYQNQKFLSKQTAAFRSKVVEGIVNYKVHFSFQEKVNSFRVYEEVEFNIVKDAFKNTQEDDYFFMDYNSEVQPNFIEVNGNQLDKQQIQDNWTGIFLNLPKNLLKEGELNRVVFEFENNFVMDGNGLYNFIDVDGKQYIYSHLEPNFCNRIYPNFDQPDLRAKYEISVVSPKSWVNIANGKQDSQVDATVENLNKLLQPVRQFSEGSLLVENIEGMNLTVFEKTVSFSTYIFFVGTGNFDWVELPQEKCYKKIPQRIYVRESLKQHLLKISDNIFELMNKLIPFYEKFFHYDFPWSKYDHIFCPDFNIGAMENVGAVTFNDGRIPRGPTTLQALSQVYNVFAHELVHTWFGDLVTMFWWDDLWLKESFADSLSYYAINNVDLSFPVTDQNIIFNGRKSWGIEADSKNSTHNIAGEVLNTEQAKSIFDGITYAKGAATLKQLMFIVGSENYSKGLGTYMNKYAFQTATFDNLLECLQEQFQNQKFTLDQWQKQWLRTPGINIIEPVFDPSSNKLVIKQSALLENFPTLRYHKIKIGFFKQDGQIDEQTVFVEPQQETIVEYDNSQNYQAVLLNYSDLDFVKTVIDQTSLEFLNKNFGKIKSPLDQISVLRGVYELVEDATVKAEYFVEFALNNYRNSQSDEVFENVIVSLQNVISSYTPSSQYSEIGQRIVDSLIKYLSTEKLTDNISVVLKTNIIHFSGYVQNQEVFKSLLQWYNNENQQLKDHPLSVQNQWSFVVLAHLQPEQVFSLQQKKDLFTQQSNIDKSDTVMYKSRTCDAILDIQGNDTEAQDKRWKIFSHCEETRYQMLAGLQGFNQPRYKENIKRFYEKYFDFDLIYVFENSSVTNALQFANAMFPKTQDLKWNLEKVEQLIPRVPEKQHTLLRFLNDQKDILAVKGKVFQKFYSQ